MANIYCTLATYVFWWNKPSDVQTTQLYELKTSMVDIMREAGESASGEYRNTPLDFISRKEWAGSLLWNYLVNFLRRMYLIMKSPNPPLQRFTTFNFPRPSTKAWLVFVLCVSMAYTSFFVGAWSFFFPSNVELQLWRAVSITQAAMAFIGASFEIIMLDAPVEHTTKADLPTASNAKTSQGGKHLLHKLWNTPWNNELTGNFPALDVPFRSVLVMTPICATYVICRIIIIAEDIASLRSLPASAFVTVDWSKFLPWI